MARTLSSPFAMCAGDEQAPLVGFLERQKQYQASQLWLWRREISSITGEQHPLRSFADVCGIDVNREWIEIARKQSPGTGYVF